MADAIPMRNRFVFIPTVRDFRFMMTSVVRSDDGGAPMVSEDSFAFTIPSHVTALNTPTGDLKSHDITMMYDLKGDSNDPAHFCLGCVLREAFSLRTHSLYEDRDPPRTMVNFLTLVDTIRRMESIDSVFVVNAFPFRMQHLAVVRLKESDDTCESCIDHYKQTGNWSEAGIFMKEKRVQDPVIRQFSLDFATDPLLFNPADPATDEMFQRFNPDPTQRGGMWFPRASFSDAIEIVSAVAVWQNNKEVRNALHGVLKVLPERMAALLKKKVRDPRVFNPVLLQSGAWTQNEFFVLDYLLRTWEPPTGDEIEKAIEVAIEQAKHDVPRIRSLEMRIDGVKRAVFRRAVPENSPFFQNVVKQTCIEHGLVPHQDIHAVITREWQKPTIIGSFLMGLPRSGDHDDPHRSFRQRHQRRPHNIPEGRAIPCPAYAWKTDPTQFQFFGNCTGEPVLIPSIVTFTTQGSSGENTAYFVSKRDTFDARWNDLDGNIELEKFEDARPHDLVDRLGIRVRDDGELNPTRDRIFKQIRHEMKSPKPIVKVTSGVVMDKDKHEFKTLTFSWFSPPPPSSDSTDSDDDDNDPDDETKVLVATVLSMYTMQITLDTIPVDLGLFGGQHLRDHEWAMRAYRVESPGV